MKLEPMIGRPGPPEPWDLDAFPAYCQHCGKTYWFRPGDVVPRHDEPNGECWTTIYAHASERDPAAAWWHRIVDWARMDERIEIIGAIQERGREA